MSSAESYSAAMPDTLPSLFKGQALHIGFLVLALPALFLYAKPAPTDWLGIPASCV